MAALICGSLAFDSIMTFEGRFAEQILPEQLHILNVSFLVPALRRDFGGCAGNIAYSLKLLGGEPLPMATLGSDGGDYLLRLEGLGISTRHVGMLADTYTAQAMIMTDRDNNQITAFHPGAMMQAHSQRIEAAPGVQLAIIAPDGRDAMLQHAEQCRAAGIPFVFDPGQGLPMFSGEELAAFIEQADWVTVNDYEGKMLCERTGWSLAELSRKVRGLVVTWALRVAKCGSRVKKPMFREWLRRRWLIPRAVVTHGVARCSMVWSAAGPWRAALRWATGWGH